MALSDRGSVTHVLNQHAEEVLRSMFDLWNKNIATDVVISCDGGSVSCHRVVLIANSMYFKMLFTFNGSDNENSHMQLSLPHIQRNNFEAILKYMYSGKIAMTTMNVVTDVFNAADFLRMTSLMATCLSNLRRRIDTCNVLELLEFAATHNCEELKGDALKYLSNHFASILNAESLKCVSAKNLLRVLHFYAILPVQLRRELLILASEYQTNGELDNEETVNKIRAAVDVLKSNCKAEEQRKIVEEESVLLIVPRCLIESNDAIFFYALSRGTTKCNNSAHVMCKVPIRSPLSSFSVSVLGSLFYIIGGYVDELVTETVFCFDTTEQKWIDVQPLNKARCGHSSTTIGSKLYVIGGYEEESVEAYDLSCNQWTLVLLTHNRSLSLYTDLISFSLYDCIYWVYEFFVEELLSSGTAKMVKFDTTQNILFEISVSSEGTIHVCTNAYRHKFVVSGSCYAQGQIVMVVSNLVNYMDRSTLVHKPCMLLAFDPLSNTVRLLRDLENDKSWNEHSLKFMNITAVANQLLCLGSVIEDWPANFDAYTYSRPSKSGFFPTSHQLSLYKVDLCADDGGFKELSSRVIRNVYVCDSYEFYHMCAISMDKDVVFSLIK